MYNIGIFNTTNILIDDLDLVEKIVIDLLKSEKENKIELNIIFTDNAEIRQINNTYRNKDYATDVISFALEDDKSFVGLEYRILGDIYISLDKVKEQSEEYKHSFRRELLFLVVHGVLHLLGYDHMTLEDEKVMFDKQEKVLVSYGIER
jgi:probable rRNA maturation factor